MEVVDKKISEYLERARELLWKIDGESAKHKRGGRVVVELAKMIQTQEHFEQMVK